MLRALCLLLPESLFMSKQAYGAAEAQIIYLMKSSNYTPNTLLKTSIFQMLTFLAPGNMEVNVRLPLRILFLQTV